MAKIEEDASVNGRKEEEELVARQRKMSIVDSATVGFSGEPADQLVGETSNPQNEHKEKVPPKKRWSNLLSGVFNKADGNKDQKFSNTVNNFTRKRFQSVDMFEELSLRTKKRIQVDEHLRTFGIVCKDLEETSSKSKICSRKDETILDPPFLQVSQASGEEVFLSWEDRSMEQQIKMAKSKLSSKVKFNPSVEIILKRYKLYVTGTQFTSTEHADACATVPIEDEITFTQLFWALAPEEKNKWIDCTLPGLKYKFNLTAVYEIIVDGTSKNMEVSTVSKFFITIGPPSQPDIRISDLDPLQVTLTWSFVETNPLVKIKGYQISVDEDERVIDFGPDVRFPVISDLSPEAMHSLKVKVLSCHSSGDSEFSNAISVRAPPRPQAPKINLLPVEDVGKITISWRLAPTEKTIERVRWCSIYIAEDNNEPGLHEKVSVESELMSFTFQDLNLSHSYRCFVKAHAGTNEISRSGYFGVCEVFSESSNVVSFTPSAPPVPGNLSVDCFLADSFTIHWTDPKEFGDAKIKGFQVMKNSEPYGPTLDPGTRELKIEGVVPGSLHRLQLIALSEHPVCKKALVIGGYASAQYFMQAVSSAAKSGSSQQARLRKIAQGDNDSSVENQVITGYEGCLPGPSLMVPFRGLVLRPSNISVQDIKGSSAVIKWDLGNQIEFQQRNPHYRTPTHFVIYWQLNESSTVHELETEAFEIKLNYLQPKAKYKVIIESRRLQTLDEQIISVKSASEPVYFSTGSPPSKPVGFRVVETSHNSIKVAWKKPQVSGFELQGYRLEVNETLDGEKEFPGSRTYCYNIHPSANLFTVSQLEQTTKWKFTLMVISNRFFEASKHLLIHENQPIPLGLRFRDIYNHWLPYDTLDVCTKSCTDSKVLVPCQVKPNSLLLKWASSIDDEGYNDEGSSGNAKVIKRQVIWYNEFSEHGGGPSSRYFDSVTLSGDTRAHLLTNLEPSIIYQINLEAVMTEKQDLEESQNTDEYSEVYDPLTVRTPAPVMSPSLMIVGFTPDTISLAWARPSTHRSPENVFSTRIVHRDLKEYRVVINGKSYKSVMRDQQKAILTKCKPGKTYHFVLATITSTHHSFKAQDLVEKFSNCEDMSYSSPISITLPNPEENGALKSVRCEYTNNKVDGPNELGYVKVVWTVHKQYASMSNFDSGIESFEIVWECSSQPDEIYSVSAGASESWILLPVQEIGSTMKIHLMAFYRRPNRSPEKSETLVMQVPSPPSKPSLLVHHVSQSFFIVEWTFEAARGANQVAGYKVYINGKKAGNILPPQFFKAKIASRANKAYEVQLQVLSSDSQIADSDLSDVLIVQTDWATIDFYKQIYLDTHGLADDYDLAHWSGRGAYNDPNEQQCGEIKLALVDISEDEIVFRLVDLDRDLIKSVKVEWSSVNSNEIRQAVFPPEQNIVSLSTFGHGVNHFIKFFGLEENGFIAAKSLQISALSAKKLEPPKLKAKKIDFTELAVTWLDKPGLKDMIVGHRVLVNNKKVAELDNTVTSYTFTKGLMCREYRFEVQALANRESLDSSLSQPLVILWPGIITPQIDQVMTTTGNAIKIAWNSPFASKNVQILGYWVHCVLLEEDEKDDGLPSVEKQIVVGPLPSGITSYQFDNLAYLCQYMIHLQLKIAGVEEFLTSNKLILRPMKFPHAPTIKAEVTGLSERQQLESELISELRNWNRMMSLKSPDSVSQLKNTNIKDNYRQMEEILTKIAQFTGKIEGQLSWEPLPSSVESDLSGYKVLVNNVQIGSVLPKTQNKFNFKFSMGKPEYFLCVGSVVQHAAFPLQKSNSITIESANFMPFSVFCYFRVHNPAAKWPSIGCCSVSDMLKDEFTETNSKSKKIRFSLPGRTNKPNPSVQVYSFFDKTSMVIPGKIPSIAARVNAGQRNDLTVVLFYTYWCLASQKIFRFLMSWASISSVKVQVITCCIDSRERTDTHFDSLASFIRGVKFGFGGNIKHTCGCFTKTTPNKKAADPDSTRVAEDASAQEPPPKVKPRTWSSTEIQDEYLLIGVPTISIISGSDNSILWQGRPIVANTEQFSTFIGDVISSL